MITSNRITIDNHSLSKTLLVMLFSLSLLPVLTHGLLDHPPEYDELLHILAARGINQTGEPAIADGVYNRSLAYTRIIAETVKLPGDDLLQSRLPALLAGMMLVALVGGWVSYKVGWLAGLSAATMLALAPSTIHLSVLVRFYTLHALIVTAMLLLLYEVFTPHRAWWLRALLLIFVTLLCGAGLQLQPLTLVSLLGAICAVSLLLLLDYHSWFMRFLKRHRALSLGVLAGAIGVAVAFESKLGLFQQLRGFTPAWAENRADSLVFYLDALGWHMPFLWPLFPVMAVAALLGNRRFSLYCLVIIVVAMFISNIASQKATRYIYHFFPIICVVWGIGLQRILRYAATRFHRQWRLPATSSLVLVLLIALVSFASTQEFKRGVKLVLNRGTLDKSIPVKMEPDWNAAKSVLSPLTDKAARVIATSGVKSLFTFGRYDYELNNTVVDETDTGEDFGTDRRTGRQVMGSAKSVSDVIDMPGTEVVILESRMLFKSYGTPADVVAVLEEKCLPVRVPEASQLQAWSCER